MDASTASGCPGWSREHRSGRHMRAMGVDVLGVSPRPHRACPRPLLGPKERDWSSCWLVAGKLHDKCGSLTRWGFSVDTSPMGFDDRACDREPEAAAAGGDLESAVACSCNDGYSIAGAGVRDGVADEVA